MNPTDGINYSVFRCTATENFELPAGVDRGAVRDAAGGDGHFAGGVDRGRRGGAAVEDGHGIVFQNYAFARLAAGNDVRHFSASFSGLY